MTDHAGENLKKAILNDFPRLTKEDSFQFRCSKGVPCFNECCADVNIALTPYDVLRMKNRLAISSGEFLDRYTVIPFAREHQFPVVLLRMNDDEKKTCPFVTQQGCSIYRDRPWACRMYPIGVASPAEGDKEKFYFLMQEEVCQGHGHAKTWTVGGWIQDQGVAPYDELGEEFKEITLHEFFLKGRSLKPSHMEMLVMVLYDLDKFRRFVFESTFLDRFEVEETLVKQIKDNDVELLRLGFRWLKFSLFGQDTMNIRESVARKVLETHSTK
jgi:Fe-S-cluster containining protein